MTVHYSNNVAETEAIAAKLAESIHSASCIALHGELGAGKTQFVRGLVRGLDGPAKSVSSPTFVLLNIYPGGRLSVYHLDAYRVNGPEDFEAIGFSELLEQSGLVVVEWAERVDQLLPPYCIHVMIHSTGEESREIQIEHPPASPTSLSKPAAE